MINSIKSRLPDPKISNYLVTLVIPVIFLILALFFYPQRTQFQVNNDEGLELMRAMLLDKGYSLYDEIWNDHPPLFAYLLVAGFRIVGYKVGFSRIIVLFLSFLLVWASGNILRMIWDRKISLVGQFLIIMLPLYLQLSLAVMTGLPSIAFAVISLWFLLEWHLKRKYSWLVVSALFLSLSVLTKISLGILGLIFCFGILTGEYFNQKRRLQFSLLFPAIIFGLVFSLVLIIAIVFWIGPENLSQLWINHVAGSLVSDIGFNYINFYLSHAWQWVLLGGIGVIDSVRSKKWLMLYPFFWAITIYFLLLNHAPVWDHHQLNITVPLAILSAQPATRVFEKIWLLIREQLTLNLSSILLAIAVLSTLAVLLPFSLPEPLKLLNFVPIIEPDAAMDESDQIVMVQVDLYKDQTEWIVTDKPIFAFRSRLVVPPELAYWSRKALSTGEITEIDVIDVIERYQPEQVLIWRFSLPEVIAFLGDDYTLVYSNGDKGLWIRNDINQ